MNQSIYDVIIGLEGQLKSVVDEADSCYVRAKALEAKALTLKEAIAEIKTVMMVRV